MHGKHAFRTRELLTADDISSTEKEDGSKIETVSDGGLEDGTFCSKRGG